MAEDIIMREKRHPSKNGIVMLGSRQSPAHLQQRIGTYRITISVSGEKCA
jgi:hypothetical protein